MIQPALPYLSVSSCTTSRPLWHCFSARYRPSFLPVPLSSSRNRMGFSKITFAVSVQLSPLGESLQAHVHTILPSLCPSHRQWQPNRQLRLPSPRQPLPASLPAHQLGRVCLRPPQLASFVARRQLSPPPLTLTSTLQILWESAPQFAPRWLDARYSTMKPANAGCTVVFKVPVWNMTISHLCTKRVVSNVLSPDADEPRTNQDNSTVTHCADLFSTIKQEIDQMRQF